jgi:hypothetical protein
MDKALGLALVTAFALGVSTPAHAAAEPPLRFHGVQYDSPGPDDRSPASLNAEYVALINTGPKAVSLADWTVRDASGASFRFGKVTIAGKGGQVWLHTGKGKPTTQKVYWGSGNYVWNNTGDTATLRDAAGRTVDACTWKSQAKRIWAVC